MTINDKLDTCKMFDQFALIIRDEAIREGSITYRGRVYQPNSPKNNRPTHLSGLNYIAVKKFLGILPDSFDKEIHQVTLEGLRRQDSTIRQIAVVRPLSGKEYWIDPTIEEFYVDRSQDDTSLFGKKIPRVYGPNETYPFKPVGDVRVIPFRDV